MAAQRKSLPRCAAKIFRATERACSIDNHPTQLFHE